MNLGGGVVLFVDRYYGVDDLGRDGLLVNDWLYGLMDVMVHMLGLDGGCDGGSVLGRVSD